MCHHIEERELEVTIVVRIRGRIERKANSGKMFVLKSLATMRFTIFIRDVLRRVSIYRGNAFATKLIVEPNDQHVDMANPEIGYN